MRSGSAVGAGMTVLMSLSELLRGSVMWEMTRPSSSSCRKLKPISIRIFPCTVRSRGTELCAPETGRHASSSSFIYRRIDNQKNAPMNFDSVVGILALSVGLGGIVVPAFSCSQESQSAASEEWKSLQPAGRRR